MSATKREGYSFWRNDLKAAQYVVAPMVDQSELPWRMLSRHYNAQLCYTPMLHAGLFVKDPIYRKEMFTTCTEDRPLIVQFCSNDPETFVQAAKLVESQCDGVDLNLGCPQTIAKRGHYGAFLQEEWDLVSRIVNLAHENLNIPITCKIRVFEDDNKTIEYAQMLEKAGCQLLTIHGRTRDQKGANTGLARWDIIKTVKNSVSIPVFANGNIQYFKDVQDCLEYTGVDGIMTAEGNLHNPALLADKQPMVWEMAEQYLQFVDKYPCQLSAVRGHLFKLWHHSLCKHTDLRMKLGDSKSLDEVKKINKDITLRVKVCWNSHDDDGMMTKMTAIMCVAFLKSNFKKPSKSTDHIKCRLFIAFMIFMQKDAEDSIDEPIPFSGLPHWVCQPYVRPSPKETTSEQKQVTNGENKEHSENQIRRALRKQKKLLKRKNRVPVDWCFCPVCKTNPKSSRCESQLCRHCCKEKTSTNNLDCIAHKLWFQSKSKKTKLEDKELQKEGKPQNNYCGDVTT